MPTSTTPTRQPLSADRVLDAAVRLADRSGMESFTCLLYTTDAADDTQFVEDWGGGAECI